MLRPAAQATPVSPTNSGHLAAFVGMVEGQDDPNDDRSVSPKANAMVLFNPVFDNGPEGACAPSR